MSRKTVYDGIEFDSRKEAARYAELVLLQKAGNISDLRLQVKYELIPAQYIDGKCAERAVSYKADFVYIRDGETIVEDVKGYKDPKSTAYAQYTIKRKLMLQKYGIRIREV